jgi:hypothetical protein
MLQNEDFPMFQQTLKVPSSWVLNLGFVQSPLGRSDSGWHVGGDGLIGLGGPC